MADAWLQAVTTCAALVCLFPIVSTRAAQAVPPGDDVFKSAVAAWQMADLKDLSGRNELKMVGAASVGIQLEGDDLRDSLASGNDGRVARLEGGCLDAGQGTDGMLNPKGSALTVSVRLRNPSGVWGQPLFSKHGGHDRLVYNLFSLDSRVGFEIGTRDTPGMTQVSVPVSVIGSRDWHDFICRYDGTRLQLFVDGVLMSEAFASGPLREGNTEPCLIGAETTGAGMKSGWKGLIDHVALWNRPLSGPEIERLSGGAAQVAARQKQYVDVPVRSAQADLYREKHRPQFHFSARQFTVHKLNPGMREEGWMNDPNGLIHLQGEYHLFAQRWNKCWIHAVSTNLVHWTELAPAFWEDNRFGSGVQSGGSVFDRQNSSGLSPDPRTPPLVAFWSGNDNRSQCISYSLDKGRTWTKYARNPVLVHPERDPKVLWYEPGKHWVMVLYGASSYFVFTSTNLLDWTEQKNSIPDCFECPDLFQLPVDGDRQHLKWVLVRGNGRYSIGNFDGSTFTSETSQQPCDAGPNFYATQSWGDIEGQEGRRVQIAWMRGGQYPDMPFNQQMTFPCDLTLRTLAGSLRVFRRPAPEIKQLHRRQRTWEELALQAGTAQPLEVPGDALHILAEVNLPNQAELAFRLRGASVIVTDQSVACSSKTALLPGGTRTIEILLDRTSIETFANGGEVSLSACFLPSEDRLAVECTRGSASISSLQIFELESIWKGFRP
jgi:fructan beta-fructosidase